ncbi:MAG: hypothetical protein N2Z22_02490 [Turneriella sp.]|nr:hypothetical protein [Leptospiraceae bacterium]MCX7632184.1 hypothetical protein [Turneriella sp.]
MLRRFVSLCLTGGVLLVKYPVLAQARYYAKTDHHGNSTENFSSSGLRLYLAADRLRFSRGDEVRVRLCLVNSGAYPISIYLHENPLKNFVVVVRDAEGKSFPIKEEMHYRFPPDYRDPHHTRFTGEVYPMRRVILHGQERYEKEIRLDDYAEWPGTASKSQLLVSAYFYPNPLGAERYFISSENQLQLLVDGTHGTQSNGVAETLPEPGITAREVVYLALSAEYSRDWGRYFKYLSLKDLIRDYPEFLRVYAGVSPEEQARVLAEFRNFLSGRGAHRLIRFRILGSESTEQGNTAWVKVRSRRNVEGFERDFLTTYYLTKRDQLWQITGIESRLAD